MVRRIKDFIEERVEEYEKRLYPTSPQHEFEEAFEFFEEIRTLARNNKVLVPYVDRLRRIIVEPIYNRIQDLGIEKDCLEDIYKGMRGY